jgi:ABC-type transport system involved in multi-copper enzyme maturation permease subunit
MMLWYKAWRETRTRFLISALVLAVFCLSVVLFQQRIRSHEPVLPGFNSVSYSQHIYQFIYSGMAKAIFIWVLFFLGLGGLQREHAHGTAGFTLALPVSRVRLVVVRMTLGLVEVAALSLLPAALIPATSLLVHQSYPLAESLHFSVLWIGCGAVLYAMTFLFSVVLGGEYTALVASFAVFFAQDFILSLEPLQSYQFKLLHIMSEFGTMHWDPEHIFLSSGPLPWLRLALFSLVAFSMLAISVGVVRRQDL